LILASLVLISTFVLEPLNRKTALSSGLLNLQAIVNNVRTKIMEAGDIYIPDLAKNN